MALLVNIARKQMRVALSQPVPAPDRKWTVFLRLTQEKTSLDVLSPVIVVALESKDVRGSKPLPVWQKLLPRQLPTLVLNPVKVSDCEILSSDVQNKQHCKGWLAVFCKMYYLPFFFSIVYSHVRNGTVHPISIVQSARCF